jgi:hypothetical protein
MIVLFGLCWADWRCGRLNHTLVIPRITTALNLPNEKETVFEHEGSTWQRFYPSDLVRRDLEPFFRQPDARVSLDDVNRGDVGIQHLAESLRRELADPGRDRQGALRRACRHEPSTAMKSASPVLGVAETNSDMFCRPSVASSPNWDGKSLLAVSTAVARSSAE